MTIATTKLVPPSDAADAEIETVKDPFADLSALRLSQSFAETLGVKKLITTVPVRRSEAYKIDAARDADAFPEPEWPTQSLNDLIFITFAGRMIEREDHPGLLRLIGARIDSV